MNWKWISWIWTWIPWFKDKKLPKKEDIIPDVKPDVKPAQGCTCDLSKPLVVPLVPEMGNNDKEVNDALYARWKAGISDNCGGLPSDIRPLLIRPAGNTFGWKYVITEGSIRIVINGERMTIWCGPHKGQKLHIVGTSDHEAPSNGARPETLPDFVALESGVEGPKKHFIYFEVR